MIISVFHRVETIVGKGENAGYHNVLKRRLSQTCQKVSLRGNGLTLSKTTNFRLLQAERVSRQQF